MEIRHILGYHGSHSDTSISLSQVGFILATEFDGLWLLRFHSGYHGDQDAIEQDLWRMPIVSGNLSTKYKLDMA